jgi:hypothetical protein
MPPNVTGGHPAAQPDSRPNVDALAKGHDVSDIVRHDGDGPRRTARGRRPLAFGSQAAPCEGRTQWAVMYQCGSCNGTHFGRSPVELTTGKRRARCGRIVWLVIARTYRGRPQEAA